MSLTDGPGRAGTMLLISGPSGCGKSTICKRLLEDDDVVFSVSATTRTPRPGEVRGRRGSPMDASAFSCTHTAPVQRRATMPPIND